MENKRLMPIISIITVSFNAEKTIRKTIESVINQTYKNIEYIIIDGESKDNTVNIIKEFNKNINYWCSEKDHGIYDAMNKGLKIANGDFVIFLGADDIFFSDTTLEDIIEKLDEKYVCYGDSYITQIRKIYWGKFNKYKISIGNICHQAIFYPKKIYKTKHYKTEYKIYADYVYNLELFPFYKFKYLNETISIFNYNGVSSSKNDSCFSKDQYYIILKTLGILPVTIRIIFQFTRNIKHMLNSNKEKQI